MKWLCSRDLGVTSTDSGRPWGVSARGGLAPFPSNFLINAYLQEATWKAQLGVFQWRGIF